MSTATGDVVIEAEGLVKEYGTFRAVDELDLTLRQGEVYGFLGPQRLRQEHDHPHVPGTHRAVGGKGARRRA